MSGRLVILPKKSWNVWNPENIARVRRDEAAAAEAAAVEDGDARAATMATAVRRMKGEAEPPAEAAPLSGVGQKTPTRDEGKRKKRDEATIFDPSGHVNFFASEAAAAAAALDGRTADEAAWAKRNEDREARKLGFFAAPVALKEPDVPWYARDGGAGGVDEAAEGSDYVPRTKKARLRLERDDRRRREADPMRGLVKVPRRSEAGRPSTTFALPPAPETGRQRSADSSLDSSVSDDDEDRGKKKKKKKKKKMKNNKEMKKEKKDTAASGFESRRAMEVLRMKRLQREAVEHRKAMRLLTHHDSHGDL